MQESLIMAFLLVYHLTFFGQSVVLDVEPNHSTFGFSISIAEGFTKVTGKFTAYNIDISYRDSNILHATIDVAIQAASVQSGIGDRDEHLKSVDFFDTEKFSEITFRSDTIIVAGAGFVAKDRFPCMVLLKL